MGKICKQILVLTLVLTFFSGAVFAATTNITINQITPLEETNLKGRVGWEQGSEGQIEAIGTGFTPHNAINPRQGQFLARRAAIVDAYRNLLEYTNGVRVDSETTMENLSIVDDTVRVQMTGMIQGAKIVREIPGSDGTYQVVMSLNMYGPNSVAQIAFDAIKPAETEPFPQPSANYRTLPMPIKPISPQDSAGSIGIIGGADGPTSIYLAQDYTGVVIVAKNMDVTSTFSPRVYDEDGNIIYGNKYIDPDFAIAHGMVDYSSLDAALRGNSRAGANPLIINAIRAVDHNCNLVVSNDDAQRILAAHAQNGFMARCAVVFARN